MIITIFGNHNNNSFSLGFVLIGLVFNAHNIVAQNILVQDRIFSVASSACVCGGAVVWTQHQHVAISVYMEQQKKNLQSSEICSLFCCLHRYLKTRECIRAGSNRVNRSSHKDNALQIRMPSASIERVSRILGQQHVQVQSCFCFCQGFQSFQNWLVLVLVQ